jgi:hypothetical protein
MKQATLTKKSAMLYQPQWHQKTLLLTTSKSVDISRHRNQTHQQQCENWRPANFHIEALAFTKKSTQPVLEWPLNERNMSVPLLGARRQSPTSYCTALSQ